MIHRVDKYKLNTVVYCVGVNTVLYSSAVPVEGPVVVSCSMVLLGVQTVSYSRGMSVVLSYQRPLAVLLESVFEEVLFVKVLRCAQVVS